MQAFKILAALAFLAAAALAQQPADAPKQQPAFGNWADDFAGDALDPAKWERHSFEGGGGGRLEVKGGVLRLRSMAGTRAGVRSKEAFSGEQFGVEARVAKVGPQLPEPGGQASPVGFATLTILFNGSARDRIEWILTSAGVLEAWSVVDGRSERLDNRNLGTKLKNPVLAVVRRGDEFLFILNGPDSPPEAARVALSKTIKNMPQTFRVMLYGYGTSENDWDAVSVVTRK